MSVTEGGYIASNATIEGNPYPLISVKSSVWYRTRHTGESIRVYDILINGGNAQYIIDYGSYNNAVNFGLQPIIRLG